MQTQDTVKAIIKSLTDITGRYSTATVFNDFCTISMASLHNGSYTVMRMQVPDKYKPVVDNLEKEYMQTSKKYDALELDKFASTMAMVFDAMYKEPNDYLGMVYMSLGIGNANTGQFFTPMHICELMANLTADKASIEQNIQSGKLITMADHACGSGAMAIGFIRMLKNDYKLVDYARRLYISLYDIDYLCVKMAYIQMAALGVAAEIVCCNTLTMDIRGVFDTPKLQTAFAHNASKQVKTMPNANTQKTGQLSMF